MIELNFSTVSSFLKKKYNKLINSKSKVLETKVRIKGFIDYQGSSKTSMILSLPTSSTEWVIFEETIL